jgi:hypothetical protein
LFQQAADMAPRAPTPIADTPASYPARSGTATSPDATIVNEPARVTSTPESMPGPGRGVTPLTPATPG